VLGAPPLQLVARSKAKAITCLVLAPSTFRGDGDGAVAGGGGGDGGGSGMRWVIAEPYTFYSMPDGVAELTGCVSGCRQVPGPVLART
jgi:hypothetical protein